MSDVAETPPDPATDKRRARRRVGESHSPLRSTGTRPTGEPVVEREAVLDASPGRVWQALTEPALLTEWLADEAEIEAEPGGEVRFELADGERRGTVIEAERERRLAFTWERPGDRESLVELTLTPLGAGTRLVVVERPLGGPVATVAGEWVPRLARLRLAVGRVLELA